MAAPRIKGRYDKRQKCSCVSLVNSLMTQFQQFLVRLDDLAVLRIHGADAVQFLQSQLSNDIGSLGAGDARLAAYCNPKGRMLGSMVIFREHAETPDSLLALVKADIAEALVKRLRMFVLRSKVTLEITNQSAWGRSGYGPHVLPWQVLHQDGLIEISAPSVPDTAARHWLVYPLDADPQQLSNQLDAPLAARDAWYAQDIEAGLGWVEQKNLELFIPQSLNFDLSGGVSFTKGCYPGQEVVARAHFRGAVKRRALPAHCIVPADVSFEPGQDVYDARAPQAPAGRIINAARTAHRDAPGAHHIAWHLLVEVNPAQADAADLRVVSPDGPALRTLSLPYSLEAKI